MKTPRNRPRKNTPNLVRVLDQETGQAIGRVVNITADGLMLVTNDYVDTGNVFNARIILPRMVEGRVDVSVELEAVWCRQDTNPKFFKAGFKYLNLAGNDGFLLEDVMHKMNLVG